MHHAIHGFIYDKPSVNLKHLSNDSFCNVQAGAISVCDEHFPSSAFSHDMNTLGDSAAAHLSQRILDDPPPQVDPSFYEAGADTQNQISVIIIHHLQQKIEAHKKYVHFLVDVGLLDRLTCVTYHGHAIPTSRLLLNEHAELLQAAITLRKQHCQYVVFLHHTFPIISVFIVCICSTLKGKLLSNCLIFR